MVGGLRCVVILVKCDPNRSRGYGAVGGRKWPFPITLASGLYNSLYYRTSRDTQKKQSTMHAINRYTVAQIGLNYGGQGQSGQVIKLFQITPYVNVFQTVNNPGL